jgi:hypothetical protein
MNLATPTAPAISATTPSPRKRLSNAPAAAALAVSTSDGWLTVGAHAIGETSPSSREWWRCLMPPLLRMPPQPALTATTAAMQPISSL